jgi:hypothetical protein
MLNRRLKINFIVNLLSPVARIAVGLITLPILLRHIGDARYGVMSINSPWRVRVSRSWAFTCSNSSRIVTPGPWSNQSPDPCPPQGAHSIRGSLFHAGSHQLHALAYNLGNFLRTLATPEPIKDWSLTSLKEKLIKIGRRSSVTAATSPSRWRKWPSPKSCSRKSCGSSRSCGLRQSRQQHEAFSVTRSIKNNGRRVPWLRKIRRSHRSTWLRRASAPSADAEGASMKTLSCAVTRLLCFVFCAHALINLQWLARSRRPWNSLQAVFAATTGYTYRC